MSWRTEDQRQRVLKRCGVPEMFLNATLSQIKNPPNHEDSLFIHGPPGGGKTGTALVLW